MNSPHPAKNDMNFPLRQGKLSALFLERSIADFREAITFIRSLPYGRNSSRTDFSVLFHELRGTCSTKHGLLTQLAIENNVPGVQLIMGIYKMSTRNSPRIGELPAEKGVTYIPEAHTYLKVNGVILDCTTAGPGLDVQPYLLEEVAIAPEQVGDFKIAYHQEFLRRWLAENPSVTLSFDELWTLREQCIQKLSE